MEPLLGPQDIEIAELLPVLAQLCGLVAVLGIIFAVRGLVQGIFWVLNKFVQGVTFGLFSSLPGVHAAEQAISSALGSAIAGIEGRIGYSWHQTARLVDHIGRELFGLAEFAWITVAALVALMQPEQWRKLWDFLTHQTGATLDYTKRMTVHGARTQRAARAQAIPNTIPRLGRIEHTVQDVLAPEVGSLRDQVRTVEEEMARVWHRVRGLDRLLGVGVLTGVVSLALARLGGSWIRCRNWRTVGRGICGLPGNWIGDLLALATDFLIIESICQILPWLEEGASVVAGPLIAGLTEVGAGLCEAGASPPARLAVPALYVPASAGVALYLP